MSIGERIASLRKERKLSQGQLAELLGITRQAVSKWENDIAVPDSLKMIHLADLLDTDIEFLSTGRHNLGRRVVLNEVKVVEKVVEKPVVQIETVEKVVEVPVVQYIEKPVIKHVYRYRYYRSPFEFILIGTISFLIGLTIGFLL